jgi:hypothetical protein
MNDEKIEKLLRKAPAINVPDGLLEKLEADIRLPRAELKRPAPISPRSWFQRWVPAISIAMIFLVCFVAFAVQTNTLSQLKQENATLRAQTGNLEALRADNVEYQRLSQQVEELDRLRKDRAELEKLHDEVAQLQGQAQEADKLRAENASLAAATPVVAAAGASEDFFAEAQARAERIQCCNNMKQIGLAARIWAGDNENTYPTDFISMTNELNNWRILQCPSDKSHSVTGWPDVAAGNVSYQMLAPGVTGKTLEESPNMVFDICPIHGTIGLVDGSVQMVGVTNLQKHLKVVDGKTFFVP